MSISPKIEARIRKLLRRSDGYIALVEFTCDDVTWVERVGPFANVAHAAMWLDDIEREVVEVLDVREASEFAALGVRRSCREHARILYEQLET